jgi:hypothetical protein
VGIGVHQQGVVEGGGERQAGQEGAVLGPELRLRPGGRRPARRCRRCRGALGRGGVVVAAHDQGALPGELHDRLQHLDRFGAVADQVAEDGEARGAQLSRVRQAGLQRAPVRMQVRQQRQLHAGIFGAAVGTG